MSNFIYILSMIAAVLWLIAYVSIGSTSPFIHLLIIAAFFGIIVSLLIDNKTSIIKDNKNLNV